MEDQERPIVERPEPLPTGHGNCDQRDKWVNYADYLEAELELCKASKGPFRKIEGLENRR